jgi:hypothetical protein
LRRIDARDDRNALSTGKGKEMDARFAAMHVLAS